jgi:pyrroline-5-carboxylate reductase
MANFDQDIIGFISAGNMAEAIIRGVLSARLLPAERIVVQDIRAERCQELSNELRVSPTLTGQDVFSHATIIVLAVKPQNIAEVAEGLREHVRSERSVPRAGG